MELGCKQKLETANKLIFVRRYAEAEKILNECLMLPESSREALVHLRRIELLSLLGKLPELKTRYASSRYDATDPSTKFFYLLTTLFMRSSEETVEDDSTIDADLRQLLTSDMPHAPIHFALGYSSEQQNQLENAKRHYEESLRQDQEWYPSAFGLSQVCYNLGEERLGDQYFQQFEALAPYNVYGNFETHRRLSQEFLALKRFDEAESSIQMLTTWWIDNKGAAPAEIQVFELLSTARIAEARQQNDLASERRSNGVQMAKDLIAAKTSDENVLYFLAGVLQEFNEQHLAFQAYKRVLQIAGNSASVVQKVGSHFLSQGNFQAAQELFEDAYKSHPDNPEIRFCLLVARLKQAGVAVEEYLIGRERLRQLTDGGDRVELLGLLNGLMQKFSDDWDVHFHFAELFMKMGHVGKAGFHYKRMFQLDPLGQHSQLRYANFLMLQGQAEQSMAILEKMQIAPAGPLSDLHTEVQWLKASYHDKMGDWQTCSTVMRPLLEKDPWNITYLIQEILNLTGVKEGKDAVQSARNQWADKLLSGEEARVSWADFVRDSERAASERSVDLAYARRKLQFLYMRGNASALKGVVQAACLFDASQGAKDLLRLLNTNFDSAAVYWGLGLLYKELWLLEVAAMWFEHSLASQDLDDGMKSQIYVDLADTYVWRNSDLNKAVELCRLSLDVGTRNSFSDSRVMTVLAHALLKQGQPRQASSFLEQLQQENDLSYEVRYLKGLVQYRNGHPKTANEIWKPLLKLRPEHMREHKIKQEVMKFYFEAAPYFPRDLSKAN